MGFYKLHPFFRDPEPVVQTCMHEGCSEKGEYRAPKSPSLLREYYWFCLQHVREYNATWNYYAHMDADEIEASRQADFTWQRLTRPFGFGGRFVEGSFYDPHGLFTEKKRYPQQNSYHQESKDIPFLPQTLEAKALVILDLSYPFSLEELKMRYKILAKRNHPDLNQGCRLAEERLKEINQAYTLLKKHLDCL